MPKPGPEESTGRFSTRAELESYIYRTYESADMTRRELADDCDISVGTLQAILKLRKSKPNEEFETLKRKMISRRWERA
jgi:hypothetical protein